MPDSTAVPAELQAMYLPPRLRITAKYHAAEGGQVPYTVDVELNEVERIDGQLIAATVEALLRAGGDDSSVPSGATTVTYSTGHAAGDFVARPAGLVASQGRTVQ